MATIPNIIRAQRFKIFEIKPMLASIAAAVETNNENNRLNEAPYNANQIYFYEGKKYGQPKFRIMQVPPSDLRPASDAFTFDKDEKTNVITLKCIIEVYRDEPDVYPLSIRNPQINVEFDAGGKTITKVMTITETPTIDSVNILQDLHAQTEIKWDEIKDLIIGLKEPDKIASFKLTVTSELWWQTIAVVPPIPVEDPPPPPVDDPPPPPPVEDPPPPPVEDPPRRTNRPFHPNNKILEYQLAQPIEGRRIFKSFSFPNKPISAVFKRIPVFTAEIPSISPTFTDPQKMDLQAIVICNYTKDDTIVFGPLSDEFEVKDLKWQVVSIPKIGENYTIAYRPTAQVDMFYFLPQVFRIKAKEQSGEPKISINMNAGSDAQPASYHINIGITLIPYYNPLAKKDLYQELNRFTKGGTKFCELRLGGYKSAKFELRDAYAGDNAVFRGKIPDSIAVIDPVNGFTLTVDCSLESFDFFKREITENDGIIIGDIVFELLSGNSGNEETSIQRIPVELNVRKLAGIPIAINPVVQTTSDIPAIEGFTINNTNTFPVTIGGTDVTLLSAIEDTIYYADYVVGVLDNPWPMLLASNQTQQVSLNKKEIDAIDDRFWTQLICEPFGISINTNPDEILGKVIDYATGDPQVWHLEVSCPLFERWADIDDATLAPFKQITSITVEVKNQEDAIFSLKLDKRKPVDTLNMARSISQILKSQQLTSRKYQYRVGTVYIINPPYWTEWQDPESTASDYLSVIPQKLTV